MIFTPRPYQLAACAAVNAALSQGESGILTVLPTGSGKTILLADLIHGWMTNWPDTRVCVLAHTKELVEQNAAKFSAYWQQQQSTDAPMGIYCAGLNQRNSSAPVLFASIQSVAKKAMQLGAFDVLLIDEAHHIPTKKEEGVWRQFIADATRANPNVRIVGLSATPYRLGSGSIVSPDAILKRVCYEVSVLELIRDGYLCPLVTKSSDVKIDTSRLHTRQGEYIAAEIESLMDQDNLIAGAVQDMMLYGADRKSWIVFCAGVNHASHVCDALNAAGVATGLVTGKTPRLERDRTIADFKARRLRALCNVNVLSEGFDFPGIDLVALLRPTKSAGLYYQQVGRSFRLAPEKSDALILDFAGVIAEHGPVDQIRVKQKPIAEEPGEAPMKDCPQCNTPLHTSVRLCPQCGYQFPPPSLAHDAQAAIDMPILSSQIKPIRHEITSVRYQHHVGKSGISTLRVDYYSGYVRVAQEWVCLEHDGYARTKAVKWWRAREPRPMQSQPGTVQQAMEWIKGGFQLTQPTALHLRPGTGDKRYPEIVRFEWENNLAAVAA
jgi:DNA repair protein RadD